MPDAALIWDPALAEYDLGDSHPLNPVRLTLTVELMQAYSLLDKVSVVSPKPASILELQLVHTRGYIEAVQAAGDWSASLQPGMGLGTEDNPIYPGMHEVAALTCGGSITALLEVLGGCFTRTFSPAGGMHHAHRARAAGFSVYNDAAVAIAVARSMHPDLRVLYLDLDAHHGDGVQEAFYGSADVMTVSVHQTGMDVFPGTGFPAESGYGDGAGYAVNVPLPSGATDECYRRAFDAVVDPITRAFRPDVIVAQLGVDAHHSDPQTELGMTLPGYRDLARRTIALADDVCDGKLAALGGGGYHVVEIVPRAWTWLMAELAGVELAEELPRTWHDHVCSIVGCPEARTLGGDDTWSAPPEEEQRLLDLTAQAIAEVRDAVFPAHGL